MTVWKKGKWVQVKDLTTEQWRRFEAAATAQNSIDDALAYAFWPDVVPDDWSAVDAQCHAMYGRSLGALYNQCRAVGRAEFLIGQAGVASKTASAASWFGEKVVKIDGVLEDKQPVTVIVDV